MDKPTTSPWLMLLVLGLASGVTALDFLPEVEGLPWYELFVIPIVWLALWSAENDVFLLFAMAVILTMLTLLRTLIPHGETINSSIGGRVIVVGTIWLTVVIAVFRKRTRRTYKWINLLGGK